MGDGLVDADCKLRLQGGLKSRDLHAHCVAARLDVDEGVISAWIGFNNHLYSCRLILERNISVGNNRSRFVPDNAINRATRSLSEGHAR